MDKEKQTENVTPIKKTAPSPHDPMGPIKPGRRTITPPEARAMLERNTHNRPLSRATVERLKNVILNGEWKYNGEAIKFDETGTLMDGQHRLTAIAEGEHPAELLVLTGLPPEAFVTLDQGRKRTGGDVLAIQGVKRYNAVSVAGSMFYRLVKNRQVYGASAPIPAYGIAHIVERHPGLVDAVEFCAPIQRRGDSHIIGLGYLAAFVYVAEHIMGDSDRAAEFAEGISVGAELPEESPLLQFRKKTLAGGKRDVMHAQAKLALLGKAFGLHMAGRTVKTLTHPPTTVNYWELIPGLADAIKSLSAEESLVQLQY